MNVIPYEVSVVPYEGGVPWAAGGRKWSWTVYLEAETVSTSGMVGPDRHEVALGYLSVTRKAARIAWVDGGIRRPASPGWSIEPPPRSLMCEVQLVFQSRGPKQNLAMRKLASRMAFLLDPQHRSNFTVTEAVKLCHTIRNTLVVQDVMTR